MEWIAGVLFVVALLVGAAAPALALADLVEPIEALDTTPLRVPCVLLFLVGLTGTLAAQMSMGESWRIGVDESERTGLVTDGAFALARNPIFAAMLPTSLGLALMVPSWVALVGLAALFLALELQVRVVEEPYLKRVHGRTYTDSSRWTRSEPQRSDEVARVRRRKARLGRKRYGHSALHMSVPMTPPAEALQASDASDRTRTGDLRRDRPAL